MTWIRVLCVVACGALAGIPSAPAKARNTIDLTGLLRDHLGQKLGDVTVRGFRRAGPGWQIVTTRTQHDGTFSLTVQHDRWLVMADADELVARGYFCVPGWIIDDPGVINPGNPICIDTELFPIGFPPSPLTCGVVGDPIVFEAVPTRPDLSVTKAHGREPVIHLTFPWTTLPMRTVRQYIVQKSVDMVNWTPITTVSLDGQGRIDLPDTASEAQQFCAYRAVETGWLVVSP
jgi:hypothetical protein